MELGVARGEAFDDDETSGAERGEAGGMEACSLERGEGEMEDEDHVPLVDAKLRSELTSEVGET